MKRRQLVVPSLIVVAFVVIAVILRYLPASLIGPDGVAISGELFIFMPLIIVFGGAMYGLNRYQDPLSSLVGALAVGIIYSVVFYMMNTREILIDELLTASFGITELIVVTMIFSGMTGAWMSSKKRRR